MPVGTLVIPSSGDVRYGVGYGAGGNQFSGSYAPSGPPAAPANVPSTARTFGLPTTLPAVLEAIEARAAYALSLDRSYVFTTLDLGDLPEAGGPADVFVALVSPRGRMDQGDVAGGGNDALVVDATITLELWTRVEMDESYRDTAALKDAAIGILARFRMLLRRATGLQLYAPVAAAGGTQSILKEPMRVVDFDLRPRIPKAGWVKHVSRWEVKYREDTDS